MKRYVLKALIFYCIFPFFTSCYQKEKTVIKVAFYNVKKEAEKSIENSIKNKIESELDTSISSHFESIISASSLKRMVENKEVDLIFSTAPIPPFDGIHIERFNNTYCQSLPDFIKAYSINVFNCENYSHTPSIKAKSVNISKNDYLLCPLLIEPYCLAIHNSLAQDLKLEQSQVQTKKYTKEDFEASLEKCKHLYTIMVSAGDDDTLNFFLSFIMKMFYDYEIKRVEYIELKDMQSEIKNTLNIILKWQEKGYFHPEWFRLKKEDVSMFMEIGDAGFVFIKQREYESLDQKIKNSYTLIPFPTTTAFSQNYLPCSILSVAKITAKSKEKGELIDKIIAYCLNQDWQQEIERTTKYTSLLSFIEKKNKYPFLLPQFVLDDTSTLSLKNIDQSSSFIKEIRYYFSIAGLGY